MYGKFLKVFFWIYKNRFRTFFIFFLLDPLNVIDLSEKLGRIPKQCGVLARRPRCAYFNLLYLSYITPVLAKDFGHQLYYISATLLGCPYFVNILWLLFFGSINWRFLSFLARMEFNVNGNAFGKSPGRRRRYVTKPSRKKFCLRFYIRIHIRYISLILTYIYRDEWWKETAANCSMDNASDNAYHDNDSFNVRQSLFQKVLKFLKIFFA